MHSSFRWLLVLLLALSSLAALRAEIVAVNSTVFNGYARVAQTDGKYQPEHVIFGEGGALTRPLDEPATKDLTFAKVARLIVPPLTKANYLPTTNPGEAGILILVFWGSTQGSNGEDPSKSIDRATTAIGNYSRTQERGADSDRLANRKAVDRSTGEGAAYENALWMLGVTNNERDSLDDRNARIIGYTEAVDRARFLQSTSSGRDTLAEVSHNRYFVVLQAYDYPTARQQKKLKPLWTTRMSVSEGGDLAEAIGKMVTSAGPYFGRDSDGLRRYRSSGTVELAPLNILAVGNPAPGTPSDAKP